MKKIILYTLIVVVPSLMFMSCKDKVKEKPVVKKEVIKKIVKPVIDLTKVNIVKASYVGADSVLINNEWYDFAEYPFHYEFTVKEMNKLQQMHPVAFYYHYNGDDGEIGKHYLDWKDFYWWCEKNPDKVCHADLARFVLKNRRTGIWLVYDPKGYLLPIHAHVTTFN